MDRPDRLARATDGRCFRGKQNRQPNDGGRGTRIPRSGTMPYICGWSEPTVRVSNQARRPAEPHSSASDQPVTPCSTEHHLRHLRSSRNGGIVSRTRLTAVVGQVQIALGAADVGPPNVGPSCRPGSRRCPYCASYAGGNWFFVPDGARGLISGRVFVTATGGGILTAPVRWPAAPTERVSGRREVGHRGASYSRRNFLAGSR